MLFCKNQLERNGAFFANRAPGWILFPVETIFSNNTCVEVFLTTTAEVNVVTVSGSQYPSQNSSTPLDVGGEDPRVDGQNNDTTGQARFEQQHFLADRSKHSLNILALSFIGFNELALSIIGFSELALSFIGFSECALSLIGFSELALSFIGFNKKFFL